MRKKGTKTPRRDLTKQQIEQQILLASRGDEQTLAVIIYCYKADMEQIALAKMKQLSAYSSLIKKEDLVQEAMIGLWNTICIHSNPIEKSRIRMNIHSSMNQYIKRKISCIHEISNFKVQGIYDPEEEIINGFVFDEMIGKLGPIEKQVYELCFKQKFAIKEVQKKLGLSAAHMKEIIRQIKIKFEQYQILNGLIRPEEEELYYEGLSKKNQILYLFRKFVIQPDLISDICRQFEITYFHFLENLFDFFPDLYKEFINIDAVSYKNELLQKMNGKLLPHQNCYEAFLQRENKMDCSKQIINVKLRKLLSNGTIPEIEKAIEQLSSKEKQLLLALYPYNSSFQADQKVVSRQFGNSAIFIINGIVKKLKTTIYEKKYSEPTMKVKR